jgi:hypothetical protein
MDLSGLIEGTVVGCYKDSNKPSGFITSCLNDGLVLRIHVFWDVTLCHWMSGS